MRDYFLLNVLSFIVFAEEKKLYNYLIINSSLKHNGNIRGIERGNKMTRQEEEIKTIRERTLKIKLSDADCKRIADKAGINGMTVAELLQHFIGDLVDGTYSSGSDERELAEEWFERSCSGITEEESLLSHLISWGYDPNDYIDALENIADAEKAKVESKEHPEKYDEEELSFIDGDIEQWNEDLSEMRNGWEPSYKPDMQKEVEKIKLWIKELEELEDDEN